MSAAVDSALRELYWLAGLLEGEGSFLAPPPSMPNCPHIVVQMCDRDVVDRAAKVLGVRKVQSWDPPDPRHKTIYQARLRGVRAVTWMRTLRPALVSVVSCRLTEPCGTTVRFAGASIRQRPPRSAHLLIEQW